MQMSVIRKKGGENKYAYYTPDRVLESTNFCLQNCYRWLINKSMAQIIKTML